MIANKKSTLQFWIALTKFNFYHRYHRKGIFLTISEQSEFLDETGTFLLEDYPDHSVSHVRDNEDQSLAPIPVPAIQAPPMAILPASQSSSRSSRHILATVHIIRADILLSSGMSSKIDHYNLTVHVNIYHEENVTIPYILEKTMQSMDEKILVLVGPNGLILYHQEGTRA